MRIIKREFRSVATGIKSEIAGILSERGYLCFQSCSGFLNLFQRGFRENCMHNVNVFLGEKRIASGTTDFLNVQKYLQCRPPANRWHTKPILCRFGLETAQPWSHGLRFIGIHHAFFISSHPSLAHRDIMRRLGKPHLMVSGACKGIFRIIVDPTQDKNAKTEMNTQ